MDEDEFDDPYTFVCNECGQAIGRDSLAGACEEADAHHEHRKHRNFYVADADGEVVLGEKERDPSSLYSGL